MLKRKTDVVDVLCLCPASGLSIALCPMSCLVSVSCPVSVSCLCLAQCQYPVSGSCLIHGVNKTAGKASYLTEQTFIWLVRTRQGYFQAIFFQRKCSQSFQMYFLLLWSCHTSSSLWSTVCMNKHLLGCSRVTSAVKTFFSKLIIGPESDHWLCL